MQIVRHSLNKLVARCTACSSNKGKATVHFDTTEARQVALDMDRTMQYGTTIRVIGPLHTYTSDPMLSLEAHTTNWAYHWHTHNAVQAEMVKHTIAKAFVDIRVALPAPSPITTSQLTEAARRFKRGTAIGTAEEGQRHQGSSNSGICLQATNGNRR